MSLIELFNKTSRDIPSGQPVSMSQINTVIGRSPFSTLTLDDPLVRELATAGKSNDPDDPLREPGSPISFGDLVGSSWSAPIVITEYNDAGTFTHGCHPDTRYLKIQACGGGGGGASGSGAKGSIVNNRSGMGGGGGGRAIPSYLEAPITRGGTISVTVGEGGRGGPIDSGDRDANVIYARTGNLGFRGESTIINIYGANLTWRGGYGGGSVFGNGGTGDIVRGGNPSNNSAPDHPSPIPGGGNGVAEGSGGNGSGSDSPLVNSGDGYGFNSGSGQSGIDGDGRLGGPGGGGAGGNNTWDVAIQSSFGGNGGARSGISGNGNDGASASSTSWGHGGGGGGGGSRYQENWMDSGAGGAGGPGRAIIFEYRIKPD